MAHETARVHADADGSRTRSSRSSQLARDFTSAGYLKTQKRDVEKMKVPNCIKPDVCYKQGYLAGYTESSSSWSFFTQWYEVMFRCDGSVLPRCVFEIGLSVVFGLVATIFSRDDLEWTPKRADGSPLIDDGWSSIGHQVVGSLLAFLTVFRSQIAWSMYLSGYGACVNLQTSAQNLARLTIGPMLAKSLQTGELLPPEAAEVVRLLKLFYFLTAEHLRASESSDSWEWCQQIAFSFATDEEIEELVREHGTCQPDDVKHDVLGTSCNLSKKQIGPAKPGARMRAGPESHLGSHGKMVDTFTFLKENKAAGEKSFERVVRANPRKVAQDVSNRRRPVPVHLVRSPTQALLDGNYNGKAATHNELSADATSFVVDPTRAKPSKVIMWLNTLMLDVERRAAFPQEPGGFMKMAVVGQLNGLMSHFMSLCKVDTIVLPMPYNQLLKLNLLAWTFTLPFVIVEETGWFCPFCMFFIGAAFFGLDQVGVMLESPFGTDAADISLLSLGKDLAEDLDVMLRTASNAAKMRLDATKKRRRALCRKLEEGSGEAAVLATYAKSDKLIPIRFWNEYLDREESGAPAKKPWARTRSPSPVADASSPPAGADSPPSAEKRNGNPSRAPPPPGAAAEGGKSGTTEFLTEEQADKLLNYKIQKLTKEAKEARTYGVHLTRLTLIDATEAALKELKDEAHKKLKRRLAALANQEDVYRVEKLEEDDDEDDEDADADDDDDDAGDDDGD